MGIPLPALGIRSPRFEGPLDQARKVVQLKSLLQGQQLNQQSIESNQLKLQQQQQAQKDQQIFRQAYMEAQGNPEKTMELATRAGVSPQLITQYRDSITKSQKALADLTETDLDNTSQKIDILGGAFQSVLGLPEDQRPQGYARARGQLIQGGVITPEQSPEQYPGDEFLQMGALSSMSSKEQIAAERQRRVDKETRRHQREMEKPASEREFQAFYPAFLEANNLKKNGKVEMWGRKVFEEMRRTGKEPGSYIPLVNERGVVIGAWNPKAGKTVGAPGIEGARKTPLSASAIKEETILGVMLEDIKRLEELSEKHPEATGPVQGRLGAVRAKTTGNLPEITELRRLAFNLSDQLLRARSGAQINEQEYARLARLVPQPSDPDIDFSTKLKSFRDEIERTLAKRTGQANEGPSVGDSKQHMGSEYVFDGNQWVKQ